MKNLFNQNQYEQVHKHLWSHALYYTNDATKAKDLVQDTLCKALTKRDQFKQGTNFKAWTSTILRNTFLNDYRKNKRAKLTDLETSYEAINAHHTPNNAEFKLQEDEIMKMINSLSEEETKVISMRRKGYSYKEISKILGIPSGTVKSRLHIARRNLKHIISSQMNLTA